MTDPDVVVVGAGILGCALSAFLAEAGASVLLVERDDVGAAASGRNSGILQHPMDAALAPLFEESLELYRGLEEHGFSLASEPPGVLLLAASDAALAAELGALEHAFPELAAERVEPHAVEPAVAPGLAGLRLATGYPVGPSAATRAFAARAVAAGARLATGADAALAPGGVSIDGTRQAAGAVVVAAGPWTPALVDPRGAWRPITPLWGVVAEVRLPTPPAHALEEAGVEQLVARGGEPPPLFSLVTTGSASALGSLFLPRRPDPDAVASLLHERGRRFVPALTGAATGAVRACARPLSADGLPLLGRAPGRDDVFVAAGHGPWGISLGPASARLVAELVLEGGPGPPPEFDPARFR
ncbi:MAG TPA: FAD-binding oxidoreductase [Solirubrobacteraceae bacterium]|nr:FAD-binding oxidoreductase [Solirubrobacteraceae bacterium]